MAKTDVFATMQQAQAEMEHLRKVFTVVRMLDCREMEPMWSTMHRPGVPLIDPCQCYKFWNKSKPCENCISSKAYREKSNAVKLEFCDNDLFEVLSRYVEVDGAPYVMELITRLDESTLIDSDGFGRIIDKMNVYSKKLYIDVLTGAYNRRFFEEKLQNIAGTAGIAILDLDDFKLYNDLYGHLAGDIALKTAVSAISQHLAPADALVRYGGDEFLIVAPNVSAAAFEERLQLVRKSVHNASVPGYERMQLSVSVGGAMFNNGDLRETVEHADRMMYYAKTHKNTVVMEAAKEIEQYELSNRKDKPVILVADSSPDRRTMLGEMLGDDYSIIEAQDSDSVLQCLKKHGTTLALILLGLSLRDTDSFAVLSAMNRDRWIDDIPVVMIAGRGDEQYLRKTYELGVSDYINCPFDADVVRQRVSNIVKLYAKQRRLLHLVTEQIYEKEKSNHIMIGIMNQIVETHNGESSPHAFHVNILTDMLLEQLIRRTDRYTLSWADRYLISTAALLHDIGKIGIDEAVLKKRGQYTPEERELMKAHTTIGASILRQMDIYNDEKLVQYAYQICRWHHERWDGGGYPDGLRGDDIPISAQIVGLADTYDGLTSPRTYRPAYTSAQAVDMILGGQCGAFNPLLLDCLKSLQNKLSQTEKLPIPQL